MAVSATAVSPAVAGDFTQSGTTPTTASGQRTSTGTVTITAADKTVTVSGMAAGTGVRNPASVI